MTAPTDSNLLIDALKAHVAFLLSGDPKWQLRFLQRFLDFLDGEPRLSAILGDLEREVQMVEATLDAEFDRLHRGIGLLWEDHSAQFKADVGPVMEEDNLGLMTQTTFESALAARKAFSFAYYGDRPAEQPDALLAAVEYWLSHASSREDKSGWAVEAGSKCRTLRSHYQTLMARIRHLEETLAGLALRRLRSLARVPTPDFAGESTEEWILADLYGCFTGERESGRLDAKLEGLSSDARLLEHEVTHRLLSGMSRASLLKRYASRCEQFDAEELRDLCDNAKVRPEDDLNWHAAKYFYDQGLNPLVDAPHAGRLRPDLFDPKLGPSLYIECKQYEDSPAQAMRGINQTWNTWARLDKQFPTQEAFLVVFRRGGQTIEPPYLSAEHEGRRMHFILIDIGESTESGSRTKKKPLALTKAMLLPDVAGG